MLSDAYSLQPTFSLPPIGELIVASVGNQNHLVAMTPHLIDWFLLLAQLIIECYYLTNGVIKPESFLMILLRCLLVSDFGLYLTIIVHDIPSFYMKIPLSEMYPFFRGVCTFIYFMHFFFALFSLVLFSSLTYASLQWPTFYSVWIKRKSFTAALLFIIIFFSLLMTVPMFVGPFKFSYNVDIKHWQYDMVSEPNTIYYRYVSMGLQGTIVGLFVLCVIMTGVNYFELKKKFLGAFRSSTGRAIGTKEKVQDTNISLFLVCFVVLGLSFTVGALSWNMITCTSFTCQLLAVLGNTLDRAKWVFYCLAFHLQKLYGTRNRVSPADNIATISQAVPFKA